MLVYNITYGIDQDAEAEWLQYMRDRHIRKVMATGLFVDHKVYRVLHDDESGTISYSVQYFARNIEDVQRYLEEFAPPLVEEHRQMFLNRHVAFMTLLDEV